MTEQMTEVVERAAKALYEAEWAKAENFPSWESTSGDDRKYWIISANAALQAIDYEGLVAERDALREALRNVIDTVKDCHDCWGISASEEDYATVEQLLNGAHLAHKTGGKHD